jgi:hypothetical protein
LTHLFLGVFFFFFGDNGVWTQGFPFTRQALYHLRKDVSPFCSCYFGYRVLLLPKLAWAATMLFYASLKTQDYKYTPPRAAIGWNGALWTFGRSSSPSASQSISASPKPRVSGINYWCPASWNIFKALSFQKNLPLEL